MGTDDVTSRMKFRLEPVPANFVARERLVALLSAPGARVTSVVAPAGYGKSALVSEWWAGAHVRERRFAALRLETRDNDPVRLWRHLVTAADALGASLPEGTEVLLRDEIRAAGDVPPEAFLATMTEALEDVPQRGILVLDDLHKITSTVLREGLAVLLAGLPSTIHVVLVSRSTIVGLGLHRLRSRGDLQEIAARDLLFTPVEAVALLRAMGVADLDAADELMLMERTEGWVTGLRYAAVGLHNAVDAKTYLTHFTGRSRDVSDFLVGEVLDGQTPERRQFLLEVSLLDELSGPACDLVTGRADSAGVLRSLEEEGLFVSSLDDLRQEFRLQPMFRDLLRDQLRSGPPARVAAIELLASQWYERTGLASSAIEHALAAGEHERAASLIVPLVADLHRKGLDLTLKDWFAAIPEDVLARTPQLALKQAWIHSYGGDPAAAVLWCERADAAVERLGGHPDVLAESACLRAVAYRTLGDLTATLSWGATATSLLDERDHAHRHEDSYARLAMTDAVAEAHGLSGDPALGMELLHASLERIRDGANVFAAVSLPGKMAALASTLGLLDEVSRYVDRAMAEARRFGLEGKLPIADAQVALGELLWERNELEGSAVAFQAAIDVATPSRSIWIRARALLGLARCRSAQRQFAEAGAILDTAEQIYPWGPAPEFFQAQLIEHRLLVAIRRKDAIQARERLGQLAGLPVRSRRLEHLAAVVALAEGATAAPRIAVPSASPRPRWDLEESVLGYRVAAAAGSSGAAELLAAVLTEGTVRGFIRTIIGPDAAVIAAGLRGLGPRLRGGLDAEYLRALEEAARSELGKIDDLPLTAGREESGEPFSEGELAIIRFLPTDLTYAEIAGRRYVSVNTVKTQLKSIYRKLGVSTRAGAAERCRRMGLLA